jgi:hypothetical protein
MPPEMRSQDARKGDETNNPEHTQAYDQIQQQLNDTRADTNISFRELKEVLDALVFRVDSVSQNTQLATSETNPHQAPRQPPAPQYTTVRDFSAKFHGTNEGTPPYYSLHRPKREFPIFEGDDVHKWIYNCN